MQKFKNLQIRVLGITSLLLLSISGCSSLSELCADNHKNFYKTAKSNGFTNAYTATASNIEHCYGRYSDDSSGRQKALKACKDAGGTDCQIVGVNSEIASDDSSESGDLIGVLGAAALGAAAARSDIKHGTNYVSGLSEILNSDTASSSQGSDTNSTKPSSSSNDSSSTTKPSSGGSSY